MHAEQFFGIVWHGLSALTSCQAVLEVFFFGCLKIFVRVMVEVFSGTEFFLVQANQSFLSGRRILILHVGVTLPLQLTVYLQDAELIPMNSCLSKSGGSQQAGEEFLRELVFNPANRFFE